MEKQYLPKTLKDSGLPPVKNWQDIQYIRYFDKERLIRVARFNPFRGVVGALYPTKDKSVFLGEHIFGIDEASPKKEIQLKEIRDPIWLGLLIGRNPPEILQDYEPDMCGILPSGSYKFSSGRNSYTFSIIDTEEPK